METTNSEQRREYVARINRVMDYVDQHLDEKLTLDGLSKVASFSPFHFHRIFSFMVGETLGSFIQRVRIEKAAMLLVANPGASVTEVAFDCGFSSSATFARAFKESFSMSASQWRARGYSEFNKGGRHVVQDAVTALESHARSEILSTSLDPATGNTRWMVEMKGERDVAPVEIVVKELPDMPVAYVRHIGPYQGMASVFEDLFARLMRWAEPRGLFRPDRTQVFAVYHDNPKITADTKLRVDACISVPEGTPVDGEIGSMTLPGGQFAVGRFKLGEKDYGQAWATIMGSWLPESGYQPDDRLAFEHFPIDLEDQQKKKKMAVDICVPVRPL